MTAHKQLFIFPSVKPENWNQHILYQCSTALLTSLTLNWILKMLSSGRLGEALDISLKAVSCTQLLPAVNWQWEQAVKSWINDGALHVVGGTSFLLCSFRSCWLDKVNTRITKYLWQCIKTLYERNNTRENYALPIANR